MGAKVSWRQEDGIILVQEHGEVTETDFARSVDEIRRLSREHACREVLVDTTEQTTPTTVSNLYVRGVHAAAHLRIMGVRVAILVDDRLRERHRFFENVARNRGFQVQIHYDEVSALAWLHSNQPEL